MHDHDKKNGCHCGKANASGNGFVLGTLVGGALVFLVGTKKGRAILRELSDKGLDAIENVKDLENLDSVGEEVASMGADASAVMSDAADHINDEVRATKSQVKKFFRGVKKK